MIYSIGYARLAPPSLRRIVDRLGAKLIDTRSKPVSRKKGFSGAALQAEYGERYELHTGLGGKQPRCDLAELRQLSERSRKGETLLLLCLEEAPGECHRHHKIAVPLLPFGVDVVHIFEDQLVSAKELQRSIDDDDDYEADDAVELSAWP